jgi:hypothetical protein
LHLFASFLDNLVFFQEILVFLSFPLLFGVSFPNLALPPQSFKNRGFLRRISLPDAGQDAIIEMPPGLPKYAKARFF